MSARGDGEPTTPAALERRAAEARAIGANYLASRLEAAAKKLKAELHRRPAP